MSVKGIHAREWISPAVATYIIHQLVEVPSNERLLQNVDWYIMPVMNPDGITNFPVTASSSSCL